MGYKVLGQRNPNAASWEVAYAPTTQAVVSSLIICNNFGGATEFSVAVIPGGGAVADINLIYSEIAIPYPETFIATVGLTLSAGDEVQVFSLDGDVVFHLYGSEV